MGASASLPPKHSLPPPRREVPWAEHNHAGGCADRDSSWVYDIDSGGIKDGKV